MQAMLLEIHQHQPARKQAVEQKAPTERRGEVLVTIEQHELVGFGPQHRDAPDAEQGFAVDGAVLLVHLLGVAHWIPKCSEGIADNRPAVFAWNVGERIAVLPSMVCRTGVHRNGHGCFPAKFSCRYNLNEQLITRRQLMPVLGRRWAMTWTSSRFFACPRPTRVYRDGYTYIGRGNASDQG